MDNVTPAPWERLPISLARSDIDVQMRRGWHAEKCSDANQWHVPQMTQYIFAHNNAIDVTYQDHHPIGLLTRCDEWVKANIEFPGLTHCKKCGGTGQVELSREPCCTATIDCPKCDGKGLVKGGA